MSKAETVAFEYAKENGTLGLDYNEIYDAVKYGYYQAEKDLELTWEDIMLIHKYIKDAINLHLDEFQSVEGQEKIYKKVLEKFKG